MLYLVRHKHISSSVYFYCIKDFVILYKISIVSEFVDSSISIIEFILSLSVSQSITKPKSKNFLGSILKKLHNLRKSSIFILFTILCLNNGVSAYGKTNFQHPEKVIKVKINKIIDGDTIKVILPQGNYSVRLNGIDCYESAYNKHIYTQINKIGLNQEQIILLGKEATKKLSEKISAGEEIDLEIIGLDTKYGRLVGNIYKKGENLNDYMKSTGYCPEYIYKPARK